jgi:hypothetical protein
MTTDRPFRVAAERRTTITAERLRRLTTDERFHDVVGYTALTLIVVGQLILYTTLNDNPGHELEDHRRAQQAWLLVMVGAALAIGHWWMLPPDDEH